MKKLFIAAAALLLFVTGAAAYEVQNGTGYFEVEKGSLSIFKQNVTAYLVIDYSSTEVVEFGKKNQINKNLGPVDAYMESQGQQWVEDWPIMKENTQARAEEEINKRNKMKIVDKSEAQYEVRLVITHLDFGNTGVSMFHNPFANEDGGAKIEGHLIVTEIASGAVACDMRIDWVQGVGNYTQNQRMMYTIGTALFGKFIPKFAGKLKAN